MDRFDVDQYRFLTRTEIQGDDLELATGIPDEHELIAAGRPFGAGVHVARRGDAPRDSGIEIQQPQPALCRKRQLVSGWRRCRIHRAGAQDRQLEALEVDLMVETVSLGISVRPLRLQREWTEEDRENQKDPHSQLWLLVSLSG
jgi:hypothetical protein